MQFDNEIDTSGLACPIPVLRLKQALNKMEGGQVLRVIATDPSTEKDFYSFTAQTGHKLLESLQQDGKYIYFIQKRIG